MPQSLEAGVPEVQHSKRTNLKAVVNDCFTLPVVWGLAAAESEGLTQSVQPPAASPTLPSAHKSNRRMHQEPSRPLGTLPCLTAARHMGLHVEGQHQRQWEFFQHKSSI